MRVHGTCQTSRRCVASRALSVSSTRSFSCPISACNNAIVSYHTKSVPCPPCVRHVPHLCSHFRISCALRLRNRVAELGGTCVLERALVRNLLLQRLQVRKQPAHVRERTRDTQYKIMFTHPHVCFSSEMTWRRSSRDVRSSRSLALSSSRSAALTRSTSSSASCPAPLDLRTCRQMQYVVQ